MMRTLIRITLTALLMSGALPMGKNDPLYYRMAKAIFVKIDKGLPPLLPFTEKMTGKKLGY